MKKIILALTLLITFLGNAQEIKFGKVSKQALEEKVYPGDSTANSAYLFKERKTYYKFNKNTGFQIVNEFHHRIKIYNKEGFDEANFNIVYYKPESGDNEKITNLKGYTFNIDNNGKTSKVKLGDNNVFDEKLNKYRSVKKITMPDIKEGSVIDLVYKHISPYRTTIDDLKFQTHIPIKKLYTKIEIPEWYVFNKVNKGYFAISPKSHTRQGRISYTQRVRTDRRATSNGLGGTMRSSEVYNNNIDLKYNIDEYHAENIPALDANEPFVSNIQNYFGGMKYEISAAKFPNSRIKTFTNSWENVSQQIYKSPNFGGEIEKTSYFVDDLNLILTSAKGDVQKALAIFEFVKNKVKWNNYYGKYVDKGVKKAYKDGTGNVAEINLILTAMLREAGLGANPVLVSSRSHGVPLFPTLQGFNYVISLVEFTDGTTMLLDATEPYSIPNVLPIRALNWNGRKVTKVGYSTWVNLNPTKHSSELNSLKVKVDAEGNVSGLLRTTEEMLSAMLGRKRYNHYSKDEVISKLEEKYNIEIENFRISNKENNYKSYNKLIKFSSEDLVEGINNKLLINPLLFLTENTNPFKSDDRTFPVDFASAWKETNNISIEIPEGYTPETLPEQFAIGLPDNLGFFKFKVENSGNVINVSSIIQINSPIISPNYYGSLKEFYTKIVAKQTEKIVLVKE
ncbi:transglutaminase domain-containing protein [Tenacibaculum sp. MEBiC06402]|uniref:transglutaminase domain-containing protein n=1 Tax=unclassified Tenacibaculum TaxID=2635139 RepID=UPI003B9A140F